MLAIAFLLLATSQTEKPAKTCATATATYAIYANHDFLRIDGSRHRIEIVSNVLDKELEGRGWVTTVAKGRFKLCGRHVKSPRDWTIRDQIDLISFSDIRFAPRRDQ
jgi:hypothetical protein